MDMYIVYIRTYGQRRQVEKMIFRIYDYYFIIISITLPKSSLPAAAAAAAAAYRSVRSIDLSKARQTA